MVLKKFNRRRSRQERKSNLISILYVEDNDINWMLMARMLRDEYNLVRARNDEEAFATLRSGTFRVILMDIQLRGSQLDGVQIARIFKGKKDAPPTLPYTQDMPQRIATIPIVFVTAYAYYKREELLAMGGDDVLYKPIDVDKLREILARVLTN